MTFGPGDYDADMDYEEPGFGLPDRTPIDWGAASEDVDPNEDGIGYA